MQARVLFIDADKKTVSLTMRPSLLAWDLQPCCSLPAGDIVEGATVVRQDTGLGILLRLTPEDEEDAYGYCHISRLADEHVDKIGKHYRT